jgi:DNA-binding MarR family transcriptional regulator
VTTSDSELQSLIAQWREQMAASPDVWTDVDLTFTQLRALFVLGRQPLRVSDLAKALGMSLASASALSDRLVRQGLVARHPDPTDRRSVFLHLAAAGARLLRRLDQTQTARLSRAIRLMNEKERSAFVTTLRAFLRIGRTTDAAGRRKATSRSKV